MRGVGVPIVVPAIVLDLRLPHGRCPELLDIPQWLPRDSAWEEVRGVVGALRNDCGDESCCFCTEGQMLSPLLFSLMGGLRPNTSVQIEIAPSSLQHFAHSGPGQELKPDRIRSALVRMAV